MTSWLNTTVKEQASELSSLNAVKFHLFPMVSPDLVVSTTVNKLKDGRRSLKEFTKTVVRSSSRSGTVVELLSLISSVELLLLLPARLLSALLMLTPRDLTQSPRK